MTLTAQPQKPSLADQYEHGDTSLDIAAEPAAAPAAPAAPQRDPATGRFATPAAQTFEHAPEIARVAERLGIPAARVAATEPAELRSLISVLQNDAILNARQVADATRSADQNRPTPPEAPTFDLGLDEQQIDPGIVGAFKKLLGEFQALKGEMAQVRQFQHGQAQLTFAQAADKVFAEDADYFGQGDYQTIDKSGEAYQRRMAAVKLAETFKDLAPVQALKKARSILRPNAAPSPNTPSPTPEPPKPAANGNGHAPTPDEWDRGGTYRPTSRQPQPEPKGTDRAVRAIKPLVAAMDLDGDKDPDMP